MTTALLILWVPVALALIVSPFYLVGRQRPTPRKVPPMTDQTPPPAAQPTMATPIKSPSLYYRLTADGTNTDVFATFTTKFIDRLLGPAGSDPMLQGDTVLLPFFKTSEGELIDRPMLEMHVTAFLMEATGGPKQYTGRALEIAHRPGRSGHGPATPITDGAFDRFMAHAAATLAEMQVPPAWIGEIADELEPLRSSVVQTVRS